MFSRCCSNSRDRRIERGSDGTLERFGPDGSYEGRYAYDRDGWDAFGPDGAYQGRISGEGERGAGRGEIDR